MDVLYDRGYAQVNYTVRNIIYSVIAALVCIIFLPICSTLMCAQCETTPTSDVCMTSAPRAKPCEGVNGTSSKEVNCMITEIKNDEGDMIRFVRGCTAVRVGIGCVEYPNKTLCYKTCNTNNCNTASRLWASIYHVTYAITTCIVHLTVS